MNAKPRSITEIDALLAEAVSPAPVQRIPLNKAAGRVLQKPLVADRSLPPFDRVMMDGFAIAWSEGFSNDSVFTITSRQLAGERPHTLISRPAESAIEIMTGAALPLHADTIIPYEETDYVQGAQTFRIKHIEEVEPKQYLHAAGSDCSVGDTLIAQGTPLGPAEAGVAASCGHAEVTVNQLPRIALIGTGDELVPMNEKPMPHQIRRSNPSALENALTLAGFPVATVLHFSDDAAAETPRLEAVVEAHDFVIVSGAVSRGTADWVAPALDSLGDCLFHGVAQRPGKPMGAWKMSRGTLAFALPGNPVSTLIGFHRHVLPYLRRCAGRTLTRRVVELAEPIEMQSRLTVFLPVRIAKDGRAHPRPTNNSGDFVGLIDSNGFIELAEDRTCWTIGEKLTFHPWMT